MRSEARHFRAAPRFVSPALSRLFGWRV